jgi:hypothetical protein
LEFLQNTASSFSDGRQGVVSNMNWQAGLLRDQPVNATEERAASGHHNASIHKIGGQFRRTAFQRDAH